MRYPYLCVLFALLHTLLLRGADDKAKLSSDYEAGKTQLRNFIDADDLPHAEALFRPVFEAGRMLAGGSETRVTELSDLFQSMADLAERVKRPDRSAWYYDAGINYTISAINVDRGRMENNRPVLSSAIEMAQPLMYQAGLFYLRQKDVGKAYAQMMRLYNNERSSGSVRAMVVAYLTEMEIATGKTELAMQRLADVRQPPAPKTNRPTVDSRDIPEFWIKIGNCYLALKDYADASWAYEQVDKLRAATDEDVFVATTHRAEILKSAGHPAEAEALLAKIKEPGPKAEIKAFVDKGISFKYPTTASVELSDKPGPLVLTVNGPNDSFLQIYTRPKKVDRLGFTDGFMYDIKQEFPFKEYTAKKWIMHGSGSCDRFIRGNKTGGFYFSWFFQKVGYRHEFYSWPSGGIEIGVVLLHKEEENKETEAFLSTVLDSLRSQK